MVWKATDPQGNEVQKCRYDVVPYLGTGGLDLGCGPHKIMPHFIGVDSCADTELFGVQMKPDIVVGTCEKLPLFGDGVVECVFSSHTLEHIVNYKAALKEWWRLVKVGGHLVLYLPHRDLYPRIGQPGANPDHKHDFAPEDIEAAMLEVAADWDLVHNETRDQLREYSFLQVYRKRDPGAGVAYSHRDPLPAKRAAIVRPGAIGDSLWASSPAAELKRQGYHVTVYTGPNGCEILKADPNVDRLVHLRGHWFEDEDWIRYYLWESRKYEVFINLIGVVEERLLPHPEHLSYHWPQQVRHARMNRNYLEEMHDQGGLPHTFRQKFYPTPAEADWARTARARFEGPMVVVAPTGSGLTKTWPHVQRFMDLMALQGVHVVVLGEIRQELVEPQSGGKSWGAVLGKDLPIRAAMALCQVADAVVGTESALVNSVACEPMPKVVLLSHSSAENLTKHWTHTYAMAPEGVRCHPCHRLHATFDFCARDKVTGFAACQAAVSAELVAELVLEAMRPSGRPVQTSAQVRPVHFQRTPTAEAVALAIGD